jgi:hypothetical protein
MAPQPIDRLRRRSRIVVPAAGHSHVGGKSIALPVMGAFDLHQGKIKAWRDLLRSGDLDAPDERPVSRATARRACG